MFFIFIKNLIFKLSLSLASSLTCAAITAILFFISLNNGLTFLSWQVTTRSAVAFLFDLPVFLIPVLLSQRGFTHLLYLSETWFFLLSVSVYLFLLFQSAIWVLYSLLSDAPFPVPVPALSFSVLFSAQKIICTDVILPDPLEYWFFFLNGMR